MAVGGPLRGRFHARPHLSASLLCRLISSVLARLLTAVDEGELADCDLVALAMIVDKTGLAQEVTGDRRSEHAAQRRSTASVDRPQRQSIDTARRRTHQSSLIAQMQVIQQILA